VKILWPSYYGETLQDDRQAIVNRFQDPDSPLRFFVGQPRTGGYGITLTAAHTMIYYSNSYDLEIRSAIRGPSASNWSDQVGDLRGFEFRRERWMR
jgi:hypothetical protein